MTNKRIAPRSRRRLLVRFANTSAFTIDVGSGGFSLGMMMVLPAGKTVEGTVVLEGTEFVFSGRVAWSVPGFRQVNLPGKIGVAFTRSSSDLAKLLEPANRPVRLTVS